ncbi:unnamed protein product [Malus baccata var. baccata]
MDRLARVGSVRRDIMDDSHLHFLDLSYLISLCSGPHRFSRQFGFVQNVPGTLKEKTRSESLQAVYMHWESCTRACTNASITLPAKDESKSNPVTRVHVRWWSKLVPFNCANVTHLRDRPMVLAHQHLRLSFSHLDASKEVGDEVDSYGDGLVLRLRQQVLNKRSLEVAQVDNDVNFRHKKKEMFRPPQSDGRVGPSYSFDLATAGVHSCTDMLLGSNLPTDGEIGDPPGAELVQNPPNFLSLPCVGRGVQESIMSPTSLPASSGISLRRLNLRGTEQVIHRIRLGAAMDIKSHIEKRICKCPLEDLTLLKEDLSKLVSVIDSLNVDSSSLKIQIAELMAASTEYSSLRAISLEKLSPDVRAHHLATINPSLAQVRSFQQVVSGDYQVRLDALVREREQLVIEASQLESVLTEQGTTLSQYQEEISRLEREKGMTMELSILSPTEVETLKTLECLLEDRLRNSVTVLEVLTLQVAYVPSVEEGSSHNFMLLQARSVAFVLGVVALQESAIDEADL